MNSGIPPTVVCVAWKCIGSSVPSLWRSTVMPLCVPVRWISFEVLLRTRVHCHVG